VVFSSGFINAPFVSGIGKMVSVQTIFDGLDGYSD